MYKKPKKHMRTMHINYITPVSKIFSYNLESIKYLCDSFLFPCLYDIWKTKFYNFMFRLWTFYFLKHHFSSACIWSIHFLVYTIFHGRMLYALDIGPCRCFSLLVTVLSVFFDLFFLIAPSNLPPIFIYQLMIGWYIS